MNDFWPSIWRSRTRATIAGLLLSVVIASVLYGFNWHTFYDTQANQARQRAARILHDISMLAEVTHAGPEHAADFRQALKIYAQVRRAMIRVALYPSGSHPDSESSTPLWIQSNDVQLDRSRTMVDTVYKLDDPSPGVIGHLHIEIKQAIRPTFAAALFRAWTFSLWDYFHDPERWHDEVLYNRSMPLYGYLLTIIMVGFGTIRALYRDQQELQRLQSEAGQMAAELDELREQSRQEIAQLEQQVTQSQEQHDRTRRQREVLLAEIEQIDQQYQLLFDQVPESGDDNTELQAARERRSKVLEALDVYNFKVAGHERELNKAREEMLAAEQLLFDVEDKREELSHKVSNSNKEIRRLRSLLQDMEKQVRDTTRDFAATGGDAAGSEIRLDVVEQQLLQWLKTSDEVSFNFSQHSNSQRLKQQAQRVDREFLERFFTHVTNPEYERGTHRTIRVITGGKDDHSGELIVSLDDDKGRTLGLRYQTRGHAPAPVYIGFVLALLLRHYCRDFRDFSIRLR